MIIFPINGRVNALCLRADSLILFCVRPVGTADTIILICLTYILPMFHAPPFFFCFKTPCQFKPLLNLRFLFFGLTSLGWLCSVTPTTYFWWHYNFWFSQESNYGVKRGLSLFLLLFGWNKMMSLTEYSAWHIRLVCKLYSVTHEQGCRSI